MVIKSLGLEMWRQHIGAIPGGFTIDIGLLTMDRYINDKNRSMIT
jgi:hypothetical protein